MFWGLKSEIGDKVGYKHVWCNQCDCQRLANQFKQKTKLTIFWIPIISIATSFRWKCNCCEQDPNKLVGFEKVKDLGLLLLAVFAISILLNFVVIYFAPFEASLSPLWAIASLGYLLYLVKRSHQLKKPIHEVGSPDQVISVSQINCVYCDGILESRPKLHCPSCMLNVHI